MSRDHIDIGDRLPARHLSRGRIPKSNWHLREPIVRKYAGVIPDTEIASKLGISRGCLSHLCSKRGISLKVPGRMSQSISQMHERRRARTTTIDINGLWKPTSAGVQQ